MISSPARSSPFHKEREAVTYGEVTLGGILLKSISDLVASFVKSELGLGKEPSRWPTRGEFHLPSLGKESDEVAGD